MAKHKERDRTDKPNDLEDRQDAADRREAERVERIDEAHPDAEHITQPLADPVANSTALVVPPAILDDTLPVEQPPDMPVGAVTVIDVPEDTTSLSGAEQNRIEVLTGKRLQRPPMPESDETPETPEERTKRLRNEKREREREAANV